MLISNFFDGPKSFLLFFWLDPKSSLSTFGLTQISAFLLLLDQHHYLTFFCLDQKKVTNRGRRSRVSSRPQGAKKVKAKAVSGSPHCGQHTALQLGLLRSPQTVTLTVYHICIILLLLPSDQTLTPNPLKAEYNRLSDYTELLMRQVCLTCSVHNP